SGLHDAINDHHWCIHRHSDRPHQAAATTTSANTASSITVEVSTTSAAIAFTLGDGDVGGRYFDGDGRRGGRRGCRGRGGGGGYYKYDEDGHYASDCTNCVWLYFWQVN
ncbi:hypothetical protein H5410_007753, partial [Solanum commersonii]